MAKYINADTAMFFLKENAWMYDLSEMDEILDLLPDADVEEVRHGEWKFNNHACGYYYSGVTCSICGNGETSYSPYCRKCGAKMDGGTKEGPNANTISFE